jgi:hypothetical protein
MISPHHRVATIRLTKERVEHQNPYPDDSTVLAVENRVYNTSAEQEHEMILHVRGLRAMIAARGGVSPGPYSPIVY